MFFNSDFMRLYLELSSINENLDSDTLIEGKKNKNKGGSEKENKVDNSKEFEDFLYKIGLVRISEIVPECSNLSPTGVSIWVPSEHTAKLNYKQDIPNFDKLSTRALPRFVSELPGDAYPLPKWEPKPLKNNDDRKIFNVDLGAVGSNQWRGACFRTKIQGKGYFIFGKIYYKGYQKVNASTNRDIALANTLYDKIMPEVEKLNKL